MKHNYFLSTLLMLLLFAVPTAWADEPYLVQNALITQDNVEARNAYLTFSTEEDGTILITISEYGTNGTTSFRGNGMSKEGFTYNDGSGDVDIRNYFNLRYTENSTEYRWVPIAQSLVRCGAIIKYNTSHNRAIEWKAGSQNPSSNAYDFTYTYGANSAIETGVGCYDSYPANTSEYCNATICLNNNNNNNYMACLTWETDGNGDVVITMSDYGNATNTRFRGSNGMNIDGFKLKNGGSEESIGTYFNKVYAGDGSTTLKLQKKADIPSGAKILYKSGYQIEWWVGSSSANDNRYSFEYTYGTRCPSMEAPVISGIDASKHITFSTSTGAEQYNLSVYRGENNLVYSQDNISSGDVVGFVPFVEATYSVYVTAVAEGLQPAVSAAYNWALTASSDPKPLSLVCDMTINEETNNNVYLTAETDLDGKIIFTLTGATWRSGGMQFDQFRVGNNELRTYFDRQNQTGSEGYEGTYTMTFTPQNNQTGVILGDQIRYSGNVEWNATSGKTYTSVSFNYIYGTKCTIALPTPSITNIDASKHITFTESAGATHYTVFVYNGEDLVYTQENVSNGDVIDYAPYLTATYTVKMIAYDNEDRSSDASAGYSWALTGDLDNLPESNVCNYLLRQGSDASSEVFISIETDDSDGSFYITMRPDNAAFRDNEYIVEAGLKYDGDTLTEYFTRSFLDEIATNKPRTIKYTPIDRNNVQYGKNITFNKYSEGRQLAWWTNTSNSHNSNQLSFTYIYGTKCSLDAAFEHSSNVSLYADHAGEDLTVDAAMTVNGNGHEIGDITVTTAGALTVGSALTANKLLVNAKPGASGQVIGAANLTVSEAWMSQQLLPDESDLKPATDWYCFTVPFTVSLANGIYTEAGVKMTSGVDYLVWTYDGAQRAATGNGWKRASGDLEAGKAYLIGFKDDETAKTFRFKKASGALAEPSSISLTEYTGGTEANNNWNAVGNPGLRHADVSGIEYVQVLNNASQTFTAYQTNETSFVIGTPFFVQGTGSLSLAAASHGTLRAPARNTEDAQMMQACVEVYRDGRAWSDDRLYVSANEDALPVYEMGQDVPTLNSSSERAALIWTNAYGMRLAAQTAPWADQVEYALTITAPADGTYTLHAASLTDNTELYLTQYGRVIGNMSASDCALTLAKGTDDSYGLLLVAGPRPVPTDLLNVQNDKVPCIKVIENGVLYLMYNGTKYNVQGKAVGK